MNRGEKELYNVGPGIEIGCCECELPTEVDQCGNVRIIPQKGKTKMPTHSEQIIMLGLTAMLAELERAKRIVDTMIDGCWKRGRRPDGLTDDIALTLKRIRWEFDRLNEHVCGQYDLQYQKPNEQTKKAHFRPNGHGGVDTLVL